MQCLIRRSRVLLIIVPWSCLLAGCTRSTDRHPDDRGDDKHDLAVDAQPGKGTDDDAAAESSAGAEAAASMPAPFIGSARCGQCHPERAGSFEQTDHARSLRTAVAAEEPELANFLHAPSAQRFVVTREGDQLHHKGWQTLPKTDQELLLCDAKIQYVMGSGAFGKSYLFRDGSSSRQSPLGFYVARNEYDMSPGYDRPYHQGFSRQVTDQCLFCHAGVVSRNQGNQNDFNVHELAIGCERCHGPGQPHVKAAEAQENATAAADHAGSVADPDWEIVDPSKLNRNELESICAQCHLQGQIMLYSGDDNAWSFRPGEDLGMRKMIYNVGRPKQGTGESIKFVGHFEQLRKSVCYQQSETLTCVTCHDPHGQVEETRQDDIQRSNCLSCHANEHCTVPIGQRQEANENRCWDCHMPRQDTEVPHVAAVNHLIGIYPQADAAAATQNQPDREASTSRPDCEALLDRAAEDSWQRQLNEEVAIATWLQQDAEAAFQTAEVVNRSIAGLRSAIASIPNAGTKRPSTGSSPYPVVSRNTAVTRLAGLLDLKLLMEEDSLSNAQIQQIRAEILSLAGSVLQTTQRPTSEYESALGLLASLSYNVGDFSGAYGLYGELTGLRQRSADYYNQGLVCSRLGKITEAEQAFLTAIRIQGDYAKPMASLGRLYRSIDGERANQCSAIAELLEASRGPMAKD